MVNELFFPRRKNYTHLTDYRHYEYHLLIKGELTEGSFEARNRSEAVEKAIRIREGYHPSKKNRVEIGFVEVS